MIGKMIEGSKGDSMKFTVIDTKTGERPNMVKIALKEEWAKHLIYCDIEGFYLGEDGGLILLDDCCNAAFCPPGRFKIIFERADDK
jgi:hypothetical protein